MPRSLFLFYIPTSKGTGTGTGTGLGLYCRCPIADTNMNSSVISRPVLRHV
jgi:hypothetical protein